MKLPGACTRKVLTLLIASQLFSACYASLPPIKDGDKFYDACEGAKAQADKDVHKVAWGFGGAINVLTYLPVIPVIASYAISASPTAALTLSMDQETARYYGDVYAQTIRDKRVKAVWIGWGVTMVTIVGIMALFVVPRMKLLGAP